MNDAVVCGIITAMCVPEVQLDSIVGRCDESTGFPTSFFFVVWSCCGQRWKSTRWSMRKNRGRPDGVVGWWLAVVEMFGCPSAACRTVVRVTDDDRSAGSSEPKEKEHSRRRWHGTIYSWKLPPSGKKNQYSQAQRKRVKFLPPATGRRRPSGCTARILHT